MNALKLHPPDVQDWIDMYMYGDVVVNDMHKIL